MSVGSSPLQPAAPLPSQQERERDTPAVTSLLPLSISAAFQRSVGGGFSDLPQSGAATPEKRSSAAENALAQLRNKVRGPSRAKNGAATPTSGSQSTTPTATSPEASSASIAPNLGLASRARRPRGITHDEHAHAQGVSPEASRRRSLTPAALLPSGLPGFGRSIMPADVSISRQRSGSGAMQRRSRVESDGVLGDVRARSSVQDLLAAPPRPRYDRSPSAPVSRTGAALPVDITQTPAGQRASVVGPGPAAGTVPAYSPFPKALLALLDGEHHTDEIGCEFEAGWPLLERWLVDAGGGKGDGDFGSRIVIIYR